MNELTPRQTADRVYAAFEARDGARLLDLMDPEFVGEVTAGLPNGWGGTYEGAGQMVVECWARVAAELDTRPVPDELIETTDGRIVVVGRYLGKAREGGRPHDAAFVHLLTFAADGRVSGLVQVTDSARWHEALAR